MILTIFICEEKVEIVNDFLRQSTFRTNMLNTTLVPQQYEKASKLG